MAIGPVPPLAGNTNAPYFDALGIAAGFGLVFASALTSTNTGFGAEYQHGTHAAAIYDSQFKGAIFPASKGGVPNDAVRSFVAAPQQYDFTLQGSFSQPVTFESNPISAEYSFGLHQTALYNSQIQSQVWGVATPAPPASSPIPLVFARPQELNTDLTLQGWVKIPSVSQGWVLTYITSGPQQMDLSLPASVSRSPIKNIQGNWNPTTIIGVWQADITQIPPRIIKPPNASSPKPIIPQFIAQSPDPTQLAAQIYPTLRNRVVNYRVPTQFVIPQQAYDDIPQPPIATPLVGQLPILQPITGSFFAFNTGGINPATMQLSGVYDYFSLTQAVLDFSHRTDIANYMDYYVQQAETRIYRDIFAQNMGNGVKWIEQPFTATITNGVAPIPSGYFALKDMQVIDSSGNVNTLRYADPQWIYANYSIRQPSSIPAYVARDGANFVFGPSPDSSYTVTGTVYAQSTPLSATKPLSWMTTYCPDLLLASCMLELQPFLKDAKAMQTWKALYAQKMEGLVNLDQAERVTGAMSVEVG